MVIQITTMKKLIAIFFLIACIPLFSIAQNRSDAYKPGSANPQLKATCDAPTTVFVDEINATSATIHWNTTGAAYYIVQYFNPKNPQDKGTLMTNLGSVVVDNLQPCTTYRFIITAKCPGGNSRAVQQAFITLGCR